VAESGNRAFKVLGTFPQQAPADTQSVCDLVANPDANQQFVVDVRI
jgi:urea transport system substrate-binding protein